MVFYAGSIEEAKDWLVQRDEKRHQGGLGRRYFSGMLDYGR